jgi:hypothetical protein
LGEVKYDAKQISVTPAEGAIVTVEFVPWAEGDKPNFPSTYCYECDETSWCDHIEAVHDQLGWQEGTFTVLQRANPE